MKRLYNFLCGILWERIEKVRKGEKIEKEFISEICDLINICREKMEEENKQGE